VREEQIHGWNDVRDRTRAWGRGRRVHPANEDATTVLDVSGSLRSSNQTLCKGRLAANLPRPSPSPEKNLRNLLPRMDDLLVSAPRNPAGVAKAAGENHAAAAREKSFEFLVDHVESPATLHAPQESGSAEKQIVLHFWDFKLNSILSRPTTAPLVAPKFSRTQT
jgi:hypothetical protein